jgi:hypothetical protein
MGGDYREKGRLMPGIFTGNAACLTIPGCVSVAEFAPRDSDRKSQRSI